MHPGGPQQLTLTKSTMKFFILATKFTHIDEKKVLTRQSGRLLETEVMRMTGTSRQTGTHPDLRCARELAPKKFFGLI
jgi:hypothetical protein